MAYGNWFQACNMVVSTIQVTGGELGGMFVVNEQAEYTR